MSDGLQRAGRRQAPVLGITGNIGTGKSTITKILAEQGVHVIDADRVVHDLYADSSGSLVKAVVAEFGRGIVAPDGTLDRTALGRIVFDDAVALGKLETIVHPAVVAEVEKSLNSTSQHTPCAIEAIKLIESDLVGLLDAVWIVEATPELQRARLCAKGMSRSEAQRRIEAQASPEEKIAHLRRKRGVRVPVFSIENTGGLAQLRKNVHRSWKNTQTALRDTKES